MLKSQNIEKKIILVKANVWLIQDCLCKLLQKVTFIYVIKSSWNKNFGKAEQHFSLYVWGLDSNQKLASHNRYKFPIISVMHENDQEEIPTSATTSHPNTQWYDETYQDVHCLFRCRKH